MRRLSKVEASGDPVDGADEEGVAARATEVIAAM
jgi:hypothetical protein